VSSIKFHLNFKFSQVPVTVNRYELKLNLPDNFCCRPKTPNFIEINSQIRRYDTPTDTRTDVTCPLCAHFMYFMQKARELDFFKLWTPLKWQGTGSRSKTAITVIIFRIGYKVFHQLNKGPRIALYHTPHSLLCNTAKVYV
jgi:hypothetical protein